MSQGDISNIAGNILSCAALIISWVSLRMSKRTNARQDELNQLLIERETKAEEDSRRADLSANLVKVGKSNWQLKVFNRGKATARNVRLIDLQEDNSVLVRRHIQRKFPVPFLEQHQYVEVAVISLLNGPSRAHIKLVWDDESGDGKEKEVTPSF